MKINEVDVIFISYDEPNADINYADLSNIVPWAKRVHGVKGSDAAHKAAAEISDTEWFVSVDADNIVDPRFFDLTIDHDDCYSAYSWSSLNIVNGLRYGNGGLKLWKKEFVLSMKSHEEAETDRDKVDFCWDERYKTFSSVYSKTIINSTPYQAWRAGFREGVKMTLVDGVRVPANEITEKIWWHNLHRLRMWSTVGAHEENGKYAILGARMGTWMANCTDWDYVQVRDFDELDTVYKNNVNHTFVESDAQDLAVKIKQNLGLSWPLWLDSLQSKYTYDRYNETIRLTKTYKG